ncbi:hypothetical protein L249_5344 [Ophiocordyceps polyrhachis-furcata BCC 54312]|uniref:RNase MRP protein 1 RNA binding domain-containing protein n=1 Tax=Ophiocordyceps polyrhachis-furcata BCC 54312 TaxID=1330021 RepID=A0A367L8N6_9HYPO|nr:hypothetical protein L249_5344 [Ophiocordyceps polyrhachis-furcata BCC 54312]
MADDGVYAAEMITLPPKGTPPSNPKDDDKEDEAQRLSLLVPILQGFNHRHRNQHGRSGWWACFNCFRRAVRGGRAERVRIILPGAFVAFSQLAADNQHAPLGLMLLTILARAHAIVATDHDFSSRHDDAKPFVFERESSSAPDRGVVVSRLGPDSVKLEKDDFVLAGTRTATTTMDKKMETKKKEPASLISGWKRACNDSCGYLRVKSNTAAGGYNC